MLLFWLVPLVRRRSEAVITTIIWAFQKPWWAKAGKTTGARAGSRILNLEIKRLRQSKNIRPV